MVVINLEIVFPVEYDFICRDFPVLNVHFITAEDYRNLIADPNHISVPIGHILVGDPRGHVKHNDSALGFW